ncbi:MAG TPA: PH domain-containing protein [Patescibacteria group bacterium]|nr:PH domain-containing protein [Patescibacteria group bacterium]
MGVASLIKQKSYEKIEYLLRRHPLTFLPTLAVFIILFLLPLAVYLIITSLFPVVLASGHPLLAIFVLLCSAYYLSLCLFLYAQFVDFYLDLWIITNDRIVDIEQHGLFSRTVSEVDLYRVQDVTVDVHGFFRTIFQFGNITVKTASSNIHVVFYDVARPNEIRRALIQLSEDDRKHHHSS